VGFSRRFVYGPDKIFLLFRRQADEGGKNLKVMETFSKVIHTIRRR